MKIKTFATIYDRAATRKGGEENLLSMLPSDIKAPKKLTEIGDDRYLSAITKAVFRAGFVWKVIENKWPGFEQAFWKFNVMRCAMMSPDDFDALCQDERIVRNPQKIKTVPENAVMILDAAQSHGSFASLVAHWPETDFVGLLQYLNKHGSRLGGNSAQYFLRDIGKDGFVLGKDGVAALIDARVIDKPAMGKAAMAKVQEAYNQWREESGLGLAQISRILAMSIDG